MPVYGPKTKRATQRAARRARRKTAGARATPAMSGYAAKLVHLACATNDPFCDAARGAKYFDGSASRTLACQSVTLTDVATDGNGAGALIVFPYFSKTWATAVVTSGSATFTGMGDNALNSLGAQRFRIVSMGVQLSSTAAYMTASGLVQCKLMNPTVADLAIVDCNTTTVPYYTEIPYAQLDNFNILAKRVSDQAQDWYPVTAPTTVSALNADNPNGTGWTPIFVSIRGGPASLATALRAKIVINFEFSFSDSSANAQLATPAAPMDNMAQEISQRVSRVVDPFIKNGAKAVQNVVHQAAWSAVGSLPGGKIIQYGLGMAGMAPSSGGGAHHRINGSNVFIADVD